MSASVCPLRDLGNSTSHCHISFTSVELCLATCTNCLMNSLLEREVVHDPFAFLSSLNVQCTRYKPHPPLSIQDTLGDLLWMGTYTRPSTIKDPFVNGHLQWHPVASLQTSARDKRATRECCSTHSRVLCSTHAKSTVTRCTSVACASSVCVCTRVTVCVRMCYCVCKCCRMCECKQHCEYEQTCVYKQNCMCKCVVITCASVSHVAILKLWGQREDGFKASVQGGQTR